eukprot:9296620-Pyramimonas_sp.AAC.1
MEDSLSPLLPVDTPATTAPPSDPEGRYPLAAAWPGCAVECVPTAPAKVDTLWLPWHWPTQLSSACRRGVAER